MNLGVLLGVRRRRRPALRPGRGWTPFAVAAWLACAAGAPSAAQASGECRADYAIRARLDDDTKRITGSETLRWTNNTSASVPDLRFHLYLNAFSNNRSTHLVEAKGKLRTHTMKEGWGWSRMTSARLVRGDGSDVDLLPTQAFLAPDDGRAEDRTVFALTLPEPVGPGATVEVELGWECQLPRVRRRTGFKDDFLFVAQWFPKLGVYEEGRGWNCHQFHVGTEFYADYGTYDVMLDLPAKYRGEEGGEPRVGGSGSIVSAELKGDDRLMVHFVAPKADDRRRVDRTGRQALVHDFAWTADPDYVVHRDTFRYTDWALEFPEEVDAARRAFGESADLELNNVDVRLLIHPERADQQDRHVRATKAALFFYGLWFGEYPYGEITAVDPAWGASAAGGMEYPTLFTCGTRLFTTPDMHVPESVTVHECGHQFWYGLVGNNEFEAAFLDEGFNSYTDSEVLWRVYGAKRITTAYANVPVDGESAAPFPRGTELADALTGRKIPIAFTKFALEPFRTSSFLDYWRDLPGLHFVGRSEDPRWADRRAYLRSPASDALVTSVWEHVDNASARANSYPRTAVVLRTLRGLVGESAFLRGMRHYATTWRYRHPYPDDFFAAFEEGSGVEEDLAWFWNDLFHTTWTGDWSVAVDQSRQSKPRGYFAEESTGEFVKVGGKGDEAGDGDGDGDGDATKEEAELPWVAQVVLRRAGELRLPIDVEIGFENGEKQAFVWTREEQARDTWLRREIVSESKLVSAVLDPSHKIWIDADMSNNQWFDESDDLSPWRWAERAFSQTVRYFQFVSRFGG